MPKKRTSLVFALATTGVALAASAMLADAFFVREDFTYIIYSHLVMLDVIDVFMWKVCWELWGFAPGINYTINMGLLLVTALAAGSLCGRLGGSPAGCGLAALLFVAHPVAVEVAGYLAARGDVLGTLFALLALHVHLSSRNRAPSSRRAMVTAASLLTLCAYLSKEMFISLPLLVLFMPAFGREGRPASLSVADRLKMAAPHFIAVGIYAAWRAVVIGDLMGGYIYKRAGFADILVNAPSSAVNVAWNYVLMFLGITFESGNFPGYLPAAITAAIGIGFWIWKGRSVRDRPAVLLLAWVIIGIAPILNLQEIIRYSPRLVYFPVMLGLIFLGRIFPDNNGRLKWIGPALLLTAWTPLWYTVLQVRRNEGEEHRRLARAMASYYLPRSMNEAAGQYKIVFGAPPGIFTLDEMFDSYVARRVDLFSHPVGTFRFMFGDRTNRVACVKAPGVEFTRHRYRDKWDYETHDAFGAFENELVFGEARKAPDILGLMSEGKPVEVSLYHPEAGMLTDMTGVFREALRGRRGASLPPVRWDFPGDAANWRSSSQLVKVKEKEKSVVYEATGEDPYMSRAVKPFDPLPYTRVVIDMRVARRTGTAPSIMHGEIHWRAQSPSPFNLKARKRFGVKADGKRRAYEVEVGKWPEWYLSGKIETLRVDPADAPCEAEIYSITIE